MKKIIKIILIVTAIMLFFAEAVSAATIMSVTDDGMSVAVSGDITNGKLTVDRRLFPYTGEDSRPTIEGLYIEQSIAAYIRSQKIEATVRAAVNGDGYTVKYYKREYDAATSTFTETEITEAKEVGDYKMVLTGKGGFRGELVCLFNIYPLPARKVNPKIKSVKDFEKDKSSDKSKVSEKNATKSEAKSEAKYLPVKISKTEDKGKTEKVVSGTKKKERDKDLSDSYEEKSDKLTLMFTGDLMCKKLMQEAAEKNGGYNFKPTFKYAKKVFSEADYVVGNLETLVSVSIPLNREYGRMQGRPFLNAPIEYLEALGYAGYQGLVMANNHCCDGGVVGIKETINAVNKAGFDNVGLYDSENDKHYFMIEEKGYKVAVLSFAVYFNENDELLTRYEQNTYLSKPKYSSIKADIAAAKKAGADYIVSYLHCGEEYSQEISARQKKYTERLAELGVDYIIGSHPHVLQRAETIKIEGRKDRVVPCAYSMGNFISDFSNEMSKETAILKLTLKKNKNGRVKLKEDKFIPCYMADRWENKKYVLIPKGYENTDKKQAKKYSIKDRFRSAIETLEVI